MLRGETEFKVVVVVVVVIVVVVLGSCFSVLWLLAGLSPLPSPIPSPPSSSSSVFYSSRGVCSLSSFLNLVTLSPPLVYSSKCNDHRMFIVISSLSFQAPQAERWAQVHIIGAGGAWPQLRRVSVLPTSHDLHIRQARGKTAHSINKTHTHYSQLFSLLARNWNVKGRRYCHFFFPYCYLNLQIRDPDPTRDPAPHQSISALDPWHVTPGCPLTNQSRPVTHSDWCVPGGVSCLCTLDVMGRGVFLVNVKAWSVGREFSEREQNRTEWKVSITSLTGGVYLKF